jgi:predicted  nucleic acid-binding Zn-ribbon protein
MMIASADSERHRCAYCGDILMSYNDEEVDEFIEGCPNCEALWINGKDLTQRDEKPGELDQPKCPYCGGWRVTNVDKVTGALVVSCVHCLRSWKD